MPREMHWLAKRIRFAKRTWLVKCSCLHQSSFVPLRDLMASREGGGRLLTSLSRGKQRGQLFVDSQSSRRPTVRRTAFIALEKPFGTPSRHTCPHPPFADTVKRIVKQGEKAAPRRGPSKTPFGLPSRYTCPHLLFV